MPVCCRLTVKRRATGVQLGWKQPATWGGILEGGDLQPWGRTSNHLEGYRDDLVQPQRSAGDLICLEKVTLQPAGSEEVYQPGPLDKSQRK